MKDYALSSLPAPYLIDWAITSKCNLSCRHCRGMLYGELTTERALSLVDEISLLKPGWVIVEGGEALLREDIFAILERMLLKQLPVHLITNSMLFTADIVATLEKLSVKVMISIDGAKPETYEKIRSGAVFETAIKWAQRLANKGMLEAINYAILKSNYTEIPEIFRLAADLQIPKINFIGLKPCHNYQEELPTPAEYGEAIRLACQGSQETGVPFFFDEPFFWAVVKKHGLSTLKKQETAGILAPSTTACIFGEYLFIEPDGIVKPCSFSPMNLSNVKDKSLTEIWREMNTSDFFKKIKDPSARSGPCLKCQFLADCKGCRSRTYVLTGDWFSSDPCCPLAQK
jgi:radical SAM protein with 4Fe4S-binding SPASM domain